ncbi:fecR family protein [Collimonas arenae]|uniref:FecR family protein n=1 Tax=Collimonas arenae TaxID=279058 RepID=A0A127QNX6_9BURK|nr:FecR domain-containing protein [Collimonas arenae]AMP01767.1 fecR family protein [Collimonas arenae]AMP11667.1 fecR family protein [Collimonas arenae]
MRSTLKKIGFLLFCFAGSTQLFAAAPALDPGSLQVGAATITYRAQLGDTLGVIAEQLTSNKNNWVQLAKLNNIHNDRTIPVGTAIIIPVALLPDDPSSAQVAAMSGTVNATAADGRTIDISIGTTLTEGTVINTGSNSFLTLALPDQSHIALPSNSQVKLTKLRTARYTNSPRTEITLQKGRVESRVSPLDKNKGRFEVHSPLAVAGVRGTNFRVDLVGDRVMTEVLSGGVAVAKTNKPVTLTLHAGQGNVTSIKGVGKAVALLPAPKLSGYPELQERPTVRFSVIPVGGAHGYRAQITTDADARNIISETESNTSDLKIDGLQDGNYFVRIAALDDFGLQGVPQTTAFKLKARPEPPFNVEPKNKSRSENVLFGWTEATNAKAYHLQVARDAAFRDLVVDEPALTATQFTAGKLALGNYFWRVATIVEQADGDDQGPYGDPQGFALLPALQIPKIADAIDGDLSFSWPSEPQQKFVVEIGRDAGFSALLLTQETATPEITVPRPATGTYYIRVKAIDSDGYVGPFSAPQKVYVGSRWVSGDGSPLLNLGGSTPAGY